MALIIEKSEDYEIKSPLFIVHGQLSGVNYSLSC